MEGKEQGHEIINCILRMSHIMWGNMKKGVFEAKHNFIIKKEKYFSFPSHIGMQNPSGKLLEYLSSHRYCHFLTCTNKDYCFSFPNLTVMPTYNP
jgi:hypothetical protein